MALQLPISTEFGITCPNGYVKISNFYGNKQFITMELYYYADETARLSGKATLKTVNLNWQSAEADNIVSTLYAYLKTLPDFQGATDV